MIKLVGGKFNFKKGKELHIKGLIETIEKFEIKDWDPIKTFIFNFHDTLTVDAKLSQKIGKTILPLLESYFSYLDTINRIRLFRGLVSSRENMKLTGDKESDRIKMTIKIFLIVICFSI